MADNKQIAASYPALRKLGGDDVALGYLLMAVIAAIVLAAGFLVSTSVATRRRLTAGLVAEAPSANIGEHYRRAIAVLRESQPFRVLVGAFALQALATGLMLAGAQYVATWVLHSEDAVTYLFVALIALAFSRSWLLASNRRSVVYAWAPLVLVALLVTSVFESSILIESGWMLLVICTVKASQGMSWRLRLPRRAEA